MGIKSTEDANKYLKAMIKGCSELADLAKEAELYHHAAIFHALIGAFMTGSEEIETVCDMFGMYLDAKCKQIEKEFLDGQNS